MVVGVDTCLCKQDKAAILRLSSIQQISLIGASNWYDPEAHHLKYLFDLSCVREESPMHHFREMLLYFARYVHTLQIDVFEAGMLASIMLISPGTGGPTNYVSDI